MAFEDVVVLDDNLMGWNPVDLSLEDNSENEDFSNNENLQEDEKDQIEEENTTKIDEEKKNDKESPESVVNKKDKSENEEQNKNKSDSSIYSTLATALVENDVLSGFDLSEKEISNFEDLKDVISDYIKKQIDDGLDEETKLIKNAVDNGIDINYVDEYQQSKEILDSITEDRIEDESKDGISVRQNLIYQDFINKGFSKDDAIKWMEKAFKAGTDIDDAKNAHKSIYTYIENQYQEKIKLGQKEKQQREQQEKERFETAKKLILDESEHFGIKIDKGTRTKIFDAIYKPIEKINGKPINQIQKFAMENPVQFDVALGTAFILTNGFKNFDKLSSIIGKTVKQKTIKELEERLTQTDYPFRNDSNPTMEKDEYGLDSINIDFEE